MRVGRTPASSVTIIIALLCGWIGAAIGQEPDQTGRDDVLKLLDRVSDGIVRPVERCQAGCRVGQRCPCCTRFMSDYTEFRKLATMLGREKKAWEIAGPVIERIVLDDKIKLERRRGLLTLGVYAPSETTHRWMQRFYLKAPEVFTDGHVIALDRQASKFFSSRVLGRARQGSLRACAYLVYTADQKSGSQADDIRTCHGVLRNALAKGSTLESVLAAAALRISGDTNVWKLLKQRLRERVQRNLKRGEQDAARRKILEAKYMLGLFRAGDTHGYAKGGWWGLDPNAPFWAWKAGAGDHLGTGLAHYCATQQDWRPTAEDMRKRLDLILSGK